MTLVAGGLALVTANGNPTSPAPAATFTGVPTTEVDLGSLTGARHMVTVAWSARDSTVALLVSRPTRTTVGTGVVAEAGGIIVAMLSAVAGARSVTAVEPDGTHQPASFVGSDAATGIAVLRIGDDLPVADFTTGDPLPGSVAVAMSEEAGGSPDTPTTHLYAGTVISSGMAAWVPVGNDFCDTAVAAPLTADDLGSPLVESTGAVAGIFDAVVGSGRTRTAIFLPADLVTAVASQIVDHGSVDHGTLGAGVVDAPPAAAGALHAGTGGAVVVTTSAGGSAARAGLVDGDRIVTVDGDDVHSAAELATRLYAEPPGAELPVTFVRDGSTLSTTVVLGDD